MLEGVASRLGSVVARLVGAREDDLRRHLMAAGVYRLSPTALLGYRALATLLLPVLALLAAPETWAAADAHRPSRPSAAGAAGRSRSSCCSGGHGSACTTSTTRCRA